MGVSEDQLVVEDRATVAGARWVRCKAARSTAASALGVGVSEERTGQRGRSDPHRTRDRIRSGAWRIALTRMHRGRMLTA